MATQKDILGYCTLMGKSHMKPSLLKKRGLSEVEWKSSWIQPMNGQAGKLAVSNSLSDIYPFTDQNMVKIKHIQDSLQTTQNFCVVYFMKKPEAFQFSLKTLMLKQTQGLDIYWTPSLLRKTTIPLLPCKQALCLHPCTGCCCTYCSMRDIMTSWLAASI